MEVTVMKKLICLFLSLFLCLSLLTVCAEGSLETEEMTVKRSEFAAPDFAARDMPAALTATDKVENKNGVYTVTTQTGTVCKLDTNGLTYYTYTQDFYASLDAYFRLTDEAGASLMDAMIQDDCHFVVQDLYGSFRYINMATLGSDRLSQRVGNIASLNDSAIQTVAARIGENILETPDITVHKINGNVWVQGQDKYLVTIVNGEYLFVAYHSNEDAMSSDDFLDLMDFMNALTVTAPAGK